MAQPGNFTPILLYSSSTSTNVPLAVNLTNSTNGAELAINIADKNLFFKDNGGVVNTVPIRQSSTSSNGWLSATDWNTFNSKAPATSGTSILYGNGSGGFSNVTIGTGITFAGGTLSATGSGGTVTSVTGTSPVVSSGGATPAISLATAYGDTLNPYASKTANYILAAPNGSAGVPTFRALVAADLPSLSGTYIPYTGASSAIDLNAKTVVNIANLGINTTSVPTILIRAIGDNNSGSRIAMRGYSSNASSSAIRVTKFRGTFASPQAPLSGDSLGKFELAGYGTTSSDGYPQASYEGVATENWGATARGTKTLFYTTPNTTTTQTLALTLNQDQTATFVSSVTATSFIGSGSSLTGVVTSVTGTSPVVSSGGQTPAISMPAATTSVSGYLTSTDWNTFNNKGSGTVTSVTGTAPVVSSGGATPAISMAAATSSVNGYLTSTDWTTFNNKGSGTVTSITSTTLTIGGTSAIPTVNLTSGIATAGTTGSSTLIPVVTIDTYGRVTSITTASNPQGTVTSVTGTAPVVSSGGASPAISMAAATGSVNGYLTSTDWTTFNGKQTALVSGTNIKTVGGASLLGSGDVGTIGTGYGGTGLTSFTANGVVYASSTSVLTTGSALVFDGTNLGIGYSPSAWYSASQMVRIGAGGFAQGRNGDFTTFEVGQNAYLNTSGNWTYLVNAAACKLDISNGNYRFNIAPSGTGTISWTQVATIFNSGGVSIGNTTDPGATNLSVTGRLTTGTATAWAGVASISSQSGYACKAGQTGAFSGNGFNINWTGSAAQLWIDTVNLGTITTVSDYRIKQDVQDMVSTALSRVKLLRPITYTLASIGPFKADGVIRESFIAHELQAIIPSSVNGEKDAVDEEGNIQPQTVDLAPVVSVLTKALQELNDKFDAYVASHP